MSPDIVIVRDGESYRLLHGHLRLTNVLRSAREVMVDIKGEGLVQVLRTRGGYVVDKGAQRLPLYAN